jgi:ribosomal protein S18 acetylase RimI-like enzyme
MRKMEKIIVLPIKNAQIPEISELLGKAYTNNPAHIAIFGKDNYTSNERFFRLILNHNKSDLFTAEVEGAVVGVIGIEKHPRPVSLESEPLQFTPELLLASESVITRLQERKSIWDKLELKESHYHFGPVAVLPKFQHKGIGGKMMEYCCRILDHESESGFLETESVENVKFYSKFGFQVINEMILFGVPNFSMKRFPLPE